MATLSQYHCTNCDYSVQMSGKPDGLMSGETLPCVCINCSSISDRLLRKNSTSGKDEISTKCYTCGSNSFEPWDYERKPCPRCAEGSMESNPNGPIILAD